MSISKKNNNGIIVVFIIILFIIIFIFSYYFKKDNKTSVEEGKNNSIETKQNSTGSFSENKDETVYSADKVGNIYIEKEGVVTYLSSINTYKELESFFKEEENKDDIDLFYKSLRDDSYDSISSGALAVEFLYECNALKDENNLNFVKEFIDSFIIELTETKSFSDFFSRNKDSYQSYIKEEFGYSYQLIYDYLKNNHKETVEKIEFSFLSFLFLRNQNIQLEEFNNNIESIIKDIVDPDEKFYLETLKGIANNSDFDCFKEGETHFSF